MDVGRSTFEAKCRFYPGDTRDVKIVWYFAAEGAPVYTGATPFNQSGRWQTQDDLSAGECGELRTEPRRYHRRRLPTGLDGSHAPEGTEAEFRGHGVLPPLDEFGQLPDELVPGCQALTARGYRPQSQTLDGFNAE